MRVVVTGGSRYPGNAIVRALARSGQRYAHIDDVAEAHVRGITNGRVGQTYPLGGENAPQMRVFEIVRELTRRPLPRRIPYAVAWAGALVEEARARVTGRMPLLPRGVVETFRHDWSMDSARSLAELNHRVSPLGEGIRALLSERFSGPDFAARE